MNEFHNDLITISNTLSGFIEQTDDFTKIIKAGKATSADIEEYKKILRYMTITS